ncbi:MAG: putative resolvase [bacterium]|nr:MAG: putative resolvase [bacterium]
MIPNPLLTPKQAAKLLGVSTRTIHRWDKDGKIQSIRTPTKMRRIPLSEVERILGKTDRSAQCCIYIQINKKTSLNNNDLEKKQEAFLKVAEKQGYQVKHIIIETDSILKENRANIIKLLQLANKKEFDILLIDNPNTLLPFGFSYLKEQLTLLGIKIEILETDFNKNSIEEEIYFLLKVILKKLHLYLAKTENKKLKSFKRKIYYFLKTTLLFLSN